MDFERIFSAGSPLSVIDGLWISSAIEGGPPSRNCRSPLAPPTISSLLSPWPTARPGGPLSRLLESQLEDRFCGGGRKRRLIGFENPAENRYQAGAKMDFHRGHSTRLARRFPREIDGPSGSKVRGWAPAHPCWGRESGLEQPGQVGWASAIRRRAFLVRIPMRSRRLIGSVGNLWPMVERLSKARERAAKLAARRFCTPPEPQPTETRQAVNIKVDR